MDCKRIFTNDFFNFFFGVCEREYYPACTGNLSTRRNKYVLLIIFMQELYMISHVLVELLEWDDVVEVDDEHGAIYPKSVFPLNTPKSR